MSRFRTAMDLLEAGERCPDWIADLNRVASKRREARSLSPRWRPIDYTSVGRKTFLLPDKDD